MSDRAVDSKISAAQLIFLMLTSRSLSLLLKPAVYSEGISGIETLIGCALAAVFSLITEKRILSAVRDRGNSPDRAFLLFAVVLLMSAAVRALVSFTSFFREMNPSPIPSTLVILLMSAVALYAVSRGVEGIARFSLIVFAVTATVVLLTSAFNLNSAYLGNLTLPGAGSVRNVITVFLCETFLCSELTIFFVMSRFVRKEGTLKHCYRVFQGTRLASTAAFAIFEQTVFAGFTSTQRYPFFSLAVIGEFSVFRNLDIIYLFVWCTVTVVKLSLMAASVTAILRMFMPKDVREWAKCVVCAAIFGVSLALMYAGADMMQALELVIMAITAVFCSAALIKKSPEKKGDAR